MDRGGRDKLDDFLDIVRGAKDFVEENESLINSVFGDSNVNLSKESHLLKVIKGDDEVRVVSEIRGGLDGVEIVRKGSVVEIEINGEVATVDMPDDVDIQDIEGDMNNGILDMRFPRNGGGDDNGDS